MAIIQGNMVKTGIGVTSLSLTANPNESILIKDIHVSETQGGYAKVYIGDSTRGYFRTSSTSLGNHLPFIPRNSKMKTILGVLAEKGIFKGYPVPEGKRFIVQNSAPATISIEYSVYDKGDIKADMSNGEESKEYTYLVYGQPSANISSTDTKLINHNNNPDEFSRFPFAGEGPSGGAIVHGVIYSARTKKVDNANYIVTKYLKIMKGEKHLFDEDKNGLPAFGIVTASTAAGLTAESGIDVGGENTQLYQKSPLFFETPLIINSQESLDTYWTVQVTGTATFVPADLEVAYVITKRR